MGPDLWELFEDGKEDDEVAAIILLAHAGILPKGVRVVTQFGEVVTVRMARRQIPEVSGDPEVAGISAGDAYLGADVEVETTGLPELSSDTVLPSDDRRPKEVTATGRGVVVGVVDWGFDFAHPDFRRDDGTTRILALWDQRGSKRPGSPQPFGYGIVHDREAINRALKTKDPYVALGYHPADADTGIGCHGTHVASIAAGSGGGGRPAGIAPEADLVVVHNSPWDEVEPSKLGDSVTLLEGIDFISRTAGDRPWVINLSMGRHGEGHLGRSPVEQGFDAAIRSTAGRAICLSAGNYFDKRIHASGQLRPTQDRTVVWEILEGKPTYNQLEFWYSWQDKFEVTVRSPDGNIAARVKLGERAKFLVGAKEVGNVYHRGQDPESLDNHITIYLYKEAPAGAWEITLAGTDVIDGRYHAWIERDVSCPKCQSRFRPEDADSRSTTGTICNGRRTFSVGAYDSHDPERRIGRFSSVGPTRDGRLKPDLCAPGVSVLAARSAPRDPHGAVPPLTRMSGTSMAAPHVTGTIALMFEAAPRRLRIEETHNLLLENTQRVSPHEESPDRFGIGYLDIIAVVDAASKIGGTAGSFTQTTVQVSGTAKAGVATAGKLEQEQALLENELEQQTFEGRAEFEFEDEAAVAELEGNTFHRIANDITSAFEGGKAGTLNLYDRGIISYGKHQATLASGTLHPILKRFTELSGSDTATKMASYLDRVKRKDESLREEADFIRLLKDAAKEPAMDRAQDEEFTRQYWEPAKKHAAASNIKTALGHAIFYDTKVQGGLDQVQKKAESRLGGRVGDSIGGKEIAEQESLRAFMDERMQRHLRISAHQKKHAEELNKNARELEDAAAADPERANELNRQAAEKRKKAKQYAANAASLEISANKTRGPSLMALVDSGDLNLYDGEERKIYLKGKAGVAIASLKPGAAIDATTPVEMEITEMGESATYRCSQPHASSEGAEAEELVMSMPATEETPHAVRRNLLLVCGGPGPYDNRDVEHDQSWANYVTPPLLLAKDKKPPFDVHDENVHWLIYKTAYERRWKDDSSSGNAVRKKAIKEVVDKGFSSYVDELEHRAKEHKWDLTWLTSAQDFWTKLTSFPPHSISRVYYWGHARDDLWLALKHSGHIAVAPEPSEIITESSIDCKLATLFRKDSDRVHRFIGCNTAKFAKKWGEIFAVPAEGVQEKVNFSAIHGTGGEPCLVGSAVAQLFNKDGELMSSGATKLTACSSGHESLEDEKAETIELADTPVAFARPSAASEYSHLAHGKPFIETADAIVRGPSQRNPEAILHEMMSHADSEGPSDGSDRALPTAREVFDSFTFSAGRDGLREQLEQHFVVVALPGQLLESGLREADVLVRRIDCDWGHVSVVAVPRLMSMEALRSEGLTPEKAAAGDYAQVVESGTRPHTCSNGFARRVTDKWGRMPSDQLLLRPRMELNTRAEMDSEADAEDENDLGPADSIDQAAAQPLFSSAVRSRMEMLLDAKNAQAAVAWNNARHPGKSGIEVSVLRTRLGAYLDINAVERAMQSSAELRQLAGDPGAVVAVAAHQFQQKVYASKAQRDGKIGEGTLDALGFVRHRDDSLNSVDHANQSHVKNDSKSFQHVKKVYGDDGSVFDELGSDVTSHTWFRLFVNAPFLGRPITNGIHFELMRKLRQAEAWLMMQQPYRDMSPVELGSALGIDEDHHGSRPKKLDSSSMHTLGLAVDIGYIKNPWVAGQHNAPQRNKNFKEVSRNVSKLMEGTEEELTPKWLQHLGAGSSFTTQAAFFEIQKRSSNFKAYLSLEHDPAGLEELLKMRTSGPGGQKFLEDGESIDHAVKRWQGIIEQDRKRLESAFLAPEPTVHRQAEAGFLNLHRDLVVALRDHGCLAWGAIDLGEHESGDMMHFDCRPTGVGYHLALPAQRTAGGHPCVTQKAGTTPKSPAHSAGAGASSASAAPPKNFRGGLLWEFTSATLPLKVAVFLPPAASMQKTVDVLFYAHGLLDRCHPIPEGPLELITDAPFNLGEVVDASHRKLILAVPYLAWEHLGKLAYSQQRPRWHALGNPANLNAVIGQALAEAGRKQGIATPSIRNLIVAGHSKAYDFLDPLAHSHADHEMSSGALARLSQVWALDSTYTFPADDLQAWMTSKPGLTVEVIYREHSRTDRGQVFADSVKRSKGQLKVLPVREDHCDLPKRRLPDLLNTLSSSEAIASEGCEADLNEFSGEYAAENVGDGSPFLSLALDDCWTKCQDLRRSDTNPGNPAVVSRRTILAETGMSVDPHPYFGLTRNQLEAVIRAGFTSNQTPEVLLALWAKEGSNRMLMSGPVAQATTAQNAKTLFRCSVYYESLGSDQFLITRYDPARHDNVVDLADAAASRQEQHFRGRVRSLVSAGVLSEDLTSAINSELAVSSGPPFTVTATVRFYALSLLLMDALFTQMQGNSFAQIGFLSSALNYIQWNIRDFRQFLTSADRHRREPAFASSGGDPLPLEQWALHTVPRAGEYVAARTNAVRFLHYLQSYRPIFAMALNLIKPGIEDLQATARNLA